MEEEYTKPVWTIWNYVPLWCSITRDDITGEYTAVIPDVDEDEVVGHGSSAREASEDLAYQVHKELRAL